MQFKKISVIVLAILMILSVMIPFVSADKASELVVAAKADFQPHESGLYEIKAGQEIAIAFTIEKNSGVKALEFDITYDPTVLDIVGKQPNGAIRIVDADETLSGEYSAEAIALAYEDPNKTMIKEVKPGVIQFNCIFDSVVEKTGKLFTILFKVKQINHQYCIINFDNAFAYPTDSRVGKFDITTSDPLKLCAHQLTAVKTQDPTCEEKGRKYVNCEGCDFDHTIEELAALGHKEVIIPAVEATFESEGLTEGIKCERCGKILKAQEVLPKLEKDFNLLAQWWFWLIIALVVIAIVTIVVVVTKKKKAGKEA